MDYGAGPGIGLPVHGIRLAGFRVLKTTLKGLCDRGLATCETAKFLLIPPDPAGLWAHPGFPVINALRPRKLLNLAFSESIKARVSLNCRFWLHIGLHI